MRARAERESKGLLTGYAAGDHESGGGYTLIDDLDAIFVNSTRMWSEDIVVALQELRPGAYESWSTTTLGRTVAEQYGIETRDIRLDRTTKKGLRKDDVTRVIAARRNTTQLPQTASAGTAGPVYLPRSPRSDS